MSDIEHCDVHITWRDSADNVCWVKCRKPATLWYLELELFEDLFGGTAVCVFGRCAEHHLDNMTPEYRKISYENAVIWEVHKS
jgi:hypothetical protein